ncbi:flagellar biosynthesis anti-sigma factor FlgM [Stenotrophomonas sp. MMGLT7]|uniref:flagellar biosynthesis anti-sigma factor FlgM n=1 Tax=Stenotrophomonas sp. MMGLT7 TaxID=2901227 RepID=UPI001E569933|nr:flagellar biosynthesis anti-sigma factor FlgM [Stenotrophomonas sp. MMGLT7]MCD7100241.1 flagellar biosynthesis anti-sigma factor FlgM [Stenotrophomonas sp. MMGLT7]
MTQKIEGTLPTAAALRSASVGAAKAASGGEDRSRPVDAVASPDSLRLTGEASGLQAIQRELSAAPAVDSGRVQAVRSSLESGSYKIDADAIASKMIALDQQLAG